MSAELTGQTAVVTGSSSGIGAAVARELARRHANVVVNYRSDREGAEAVAGEIAGSGGQALVVQGDVSSEDDVDRLFSETVSRFGALDILVANAGIQKDAPLRSMTLDDWRAVLDVDLTGQFLCCRRAVDIFCRQGVPAHSRAAGKIVCMSSVHQEIPWAGHVNYAAAKGAVDMLMRSMAQELAEEKIRVNGVAPGAIKTDINRKVWENEETAGELMKLIPYGRIGDPEDVAKPVAWLVSDEADYITGATLFIDGGMSLYPAFRDNG